MPPEPRSLHARVSSFAALDARVARVLVLGTMPGVASLRSGEYYAHPRNAFWPIMVALLDGTSPQWAGAHAIAYPQRTALLCRHGIAVWDVLAECHRPGSLDSAIDQRSARANPIAHFVGHQAALRLIAFNGQAAARLFKRHLQADVDAMLAREDRTLQYATLPSTSPAMASLSLAEKARRWHPVIGRELPTLSR